jgi:hypothetical protein
MVLYRTKCLFYLIIITDNLIKFVKISFAIMLPIPKLKSPN